MGGQNLSSRQDKGREVRMSDKNELKEWIAYIKSPYRRRIYIDFVASGLSQYFDESKVSLPCALYEIRSSYFREYRLASALWRRRLLRINKYGNLPKTQAEIDYLEQIKGIYD